MIVKIYFVILRQRQNNHEMSLTFSSQKRNNHNIFTVILLRKNNDRGIEIFSFPLLIILLETAIIIRVSITWTKTDVVPRVILFLPFTGFC